MSLGVDYAYGWRAGLGGALKTNGKTFVCRYLSGGSSKDITAAEIADLHSAGIDIVLVWETDGRTGPLEGSQGGLLDAEAACAQAARLGVPTGTALYFAVDFQPSTQGMAFIKSYAQQVFNTCRSHGFRSGIYGGLGTIQAVNGLVDLRWQTYAWSGGVWDPGAAIRQYLNGQSISGITADLDQSMTSDFGQWTAGAQPAPHPVPEEDMADLGVMIRRSSDGYVVYIVNGVSNHVPDPTSLAALQNAGVPTINSLTDPFFTSVVAAYTAPRAVSIGQGVSGNLSVSGNLNVP